MSAGEPAAREKSPVIATVAVATDDVFDPVPTPLSCTSNWNEVEATPGAATNVSWPAAMALAEITCPAVTAWPFRLSVPAPGSETITTACNAFAGASFGSANGNSKVEKTKGVFATALIEKLAVVGG